MNFNKKLVILIGFISAILLSSSYVNAGMIYEGQNTFNAAKTFYQRQTFSPGALYTERKDVTNEDNIYFSFYPEYGRETIGAILFSSNKSIILENLDWFYDIKDNTNEEGNYPESRDSLGAIESEEMMIEFTVIANFSEIIEILEDREERQINGSYLYAVAIAMNPILSTIDYISDVLTVLYLGDGDFYYGYPYHSESTNLEVKEYAELFQSGENLTIKIGLKENLNELENFSLLKIQVSIYELGILNMYTDSIDFDDSNEIIFSQQINASEGNYDFTVILYGLHNGILIKDSIGNIDQDFEIYNNRPQILILSIIMPVGVILLIYIPALITRRKTANHNLQIFLANSSSQEEDNDE